jgi:hypothetical protein
MFSTPFNPWIYLLAGSPAVEVGTASCVGISLRRLLEVVRGEAAGGPGRVVAGQFVLAEEWVVCAPTCALHSVG